MTDMPPPPPPSVPPPGAYATPPAGAPVYAANGSAPAGYYVVARQPTNTLALVSFIMSLVALAMLPIVGSIAAIVLAHQARKQIAVTREEGGGLATAGLIIGWVGLGMWGLFVIGYIVFFIAILGLSAVSTY